MFRVLTVSREFGSGGSIVAQMVANRLGWHLLDKNLVDEIAGKARVDPGFARQHDERVDSWMHRVSRRALWSGGVDAAAPVASADVFDCDTMASLARNLIEEAHAKGSCVIVGRGAQCILQNHDDVFHVFIYAPLREKIQRVRERLQSPPDVEELIRATDRRRSEYIKFNFGCDWNNPHLYHAMISTKVGEETVATMITGAIQSGPVAG